jgi:hypothetical protein
MEEAEVPLEHLHEEIHRHAEQSGQKWISWVALSTAILAVLAAIAGLLSGSHANEAMMKQIESADQWAFYQAKGIKATVLDAKMSLTDSTSGADREKAAKYSEEQNEIQKEAREKEGEAKQNFYQHEVFAWGNLLSDRNRDRGHFGANETETLLAGEYDHRRDRLRFPRARFCSTLNHACPGD